MQVSEALATNLIKVDSDATLVEVLETMLKNRVRCLPVIDKGELAGIITFNGSGRGEPSNAGNGASPA